MSDVVQLMTRAKALAGETRRETAALHLIADELDDTLARLRERARQMRRTVPPITREGNVIRVPLWRWRLHHV